MEVLSHGRLTLDYSEDTAHTVEVIREENEHGELGSFGFTLLYEKPPIVGTIVPGGPAERAGLKKQEVVIAVNGQDITHFSHQEVVSLIYNTQSPGVWLLVCEPSTPQKNPYVFGRGLQGGLGNFSMSQSSPVIPRNVMDPSRRPLYARENPPGYSEVNRYPPNPGMSGSGYSIGGRALTSSVAVLSSSIPPLKRRVLQHSMGPSSQSAQNGIDGGGGIYVKSSPLHSGGQQQQQQQNSVFTSASVMVLYIGPVEIPDGWSSRGLSAKCIQECTRRLLSQRQEFIEVFLEITLSGMRVLNVSRNTLVKHKRDELYYCGVCTDDEQYFAVVTRKTDQKSSHTKLVIDPEVGQTVPSEVGKSSRANICHVFRVIQSKSVLVLHSEDKKGKLQAPDVKPKTIPVQSCVTLINAVRGLFVGSSALDESPVSSSANQSLKVGPSSMSFYSAGSSGSNGSNEYESPYGSPEKLSRRKKYDVVDLRPTPTRMSPPSSHSSSAPANMYVPEPVRGGQGPYPHLMSTPAFRTESGGNGGKTWYATSSPKENHSRTGSWDNRDSRNRPNSGNFATFRIDGDFGGGVYAGAGGGSGGQVNTTGGGGGTRKIPDPLARKISDESSLSSISSSRTGSPAKLSFRSSFASRSRSPSPNRSLSYSSGSRSRSPSPGKVRSTATQVLTTPSRFAGGVNGLALEYYGSRHGALSPVSVVSSMLGSRVGLRRQGSESSIMEIQALEQLNSQIGSPFHRGGGGGLPQKNGPLSSSIGSVATLTTVADEECDEPENLGRVGGWVASFDKLLADPLGVQCLLQFLEKEHCEENIMFWRDVNEFNQKAPQMQNLQQEVKRIYDQYLCPSAPHTINIDDRVQKAVESHLSNPPLNIFSEAQDHIYRLMKMDCYPRFKRSELVKDCLLAEVEGRTLPIETAPERRPQQPQYGIWKKQRSSIFSRFARGTRTQQSLNKGVWAPTTGVPTAEGGKKGSRKDKGSGKREDPKKAQAGKGKAPAAEEPSKADDFPPENHLEFLKAHKGNIFEVNLPNKVTKIMEVPAKGVVRDAIRPVLKKHGYSFDIMELRFADTFMPVDMDSPASILIGQHIIVIKSKNTFVAVFPDVPEKILPADGKKSLKQLFVEVLRDLGKAQNFAIYMEGSRVPLQLDTDTSVLVGQRVVLKYLPGPAPSTKPATDPSPGLTRSKPSKSSLNSSAGSNKEGDVDDLISMICRLTSDTLGDQRTSPTPCTTPEPGHYQDTKSQGSSNEGEQRTPQKEKEKEKRQSRSHHKRTRSQGGPKPNSGSPNTDRRFLNVSPSSGSGASSISGHGGHSPSGGSKSSKRRSAHDKKMMMASKSSDMLVESEGVDSEQQQLWYEQQRMDSRRPPPGGRPLVHPALKSAFYRTQSGVTISNTAKPEPIPQRSFSPPGNFSQRDTSPPPPTSKPPPLPTDAVQRRTSGDNKRMASARLSGVSIQSMDSGSSGDSHTAIMSNDPRQLQQRSDYPYARSGRSHTVGSSEAPQFFPGAFPSMDGGHRRLAPTNSTPMYVNSSTIAQEKARSSSMSYQRNRPANVNTSPPLVGEAGHPLDSIVHQAYSNAPGGGNNHQRQHSCPSKQVDYSTAGHPLQNSVRGGVVPGSGATLSSYPWHQAQRRTSQPHQPHRTAAERLKLTHNPELLQRGDRLVQKEIEEFRHHTTSSESSSSEHGRTPLSPTTHMLVVTDDDDSTVNQRETFV